MVTVDFNFEEKSWAGNVYFNFFANVKGTTATSYFWDFGDGKISIEANPKHNYVNKGIYSVEFTVATDDGSEIRTLKEVIVEEDFKVPDLSTFEPMENPNKNNPTDKKLTKKLSGFSKAMVIVVFILVILLIVAFTNASEFFKNPYVITILAILSVFTTIMGFVKREEK